MKTRFILIPGLIVVLLLAYLPARAVISQNPQEDLIKNLKDQTGGTVQIAYHSETGMVRYLGTEPGKPIPHAAGLASGATPEEAARLFMQTYGTLFGIPNQAGELVVMRTSQADRGRAFVRFQQVYQDVPVMGGELIVQLDRAGNVLSANGEALPTPGVDVNPTVVADAASQKALEKVAQEYQVDANTLTASTPELWIFNQALLGGKGPRVNSLVWRMDVQPAGLGTFRELVLVEAHLGFIALHFNQVDTAKNRSIYDNNNNPALGLPGNGPVRIEGGPPSGVTDVNNAYDFAGATYDFYLNTHGRDSIDNAGMALLSTVRYCPNVLSCPYQNAFWNGSQMVYGDGFTSGDDVVGHEMTHGVTDHESSLFYYYQSGAINEAFSDIWGEFIDLTNVQPSDTPAVRWLMGEDLSIGAIRDMKNPPHFNDPDKMTSIYYTCDGNEQDSGGVHTNSGVANKAAYLMVDGDTFNGKTVTGLGITKTAKIFYEAQTNLMTSATDYADLYNDLQQACTNLVGTNGITTSDCNQVKNAVDAVEMYLQPTSCAAPEAPLCTTGTPVYLYSDNLENTSSGNWASSATTGTNRWYYPQNPNPYSFDATYATSGVYNMWGYDQPATADYNIGMTGNVALPPGTPAYLHFDHSYGFDDYITNEYDGGMIEYSINSGSTWNDAGALFTHNGYNGALSSGTTNPLAPRQAFVAESNGYISTRLDLSSLAGQNVRFRFRIGTDSSSDDFGWFIDDINIYTCSTAGLEFVYLPIVRHSGTPPASGWTTILQEDFEGTFPGLWNVFDNDGATNGEYYWNKRTCKPFAGGYSGWGVGGGAQGGALSCGSNYPNNADSWMIYGPFSLSGSTAADLTFKLWTYSESTYDGVCRLASTNGTSFSGTCTSGNSGGWVDRVLDLSSYIGQANVWVALQFSSDGSNTFAEGGYVDNIVLRKCTSGCTLAGQGGFADSNAGLIEFPIQVRLER